MTTPKTPKKKKPPVKRTRGTAPKKTKKSAESEIPPDVEAGDNAKAAEPPSTPQVPKVVVICAPGLDGHLGEVAEFLKANYEVKFCVTFDLETIFNAVKWADKVWIEWANKTAVDVTSLGHLMYQKQVILRLHSYEAFTDDLDWIHWACITDLIFIAENIKEIVLKRYPAIEFNVDRIHVIPNGIDCERFALPDSRRYQTTPLNKKIASLGYVDYKKGPQLLWTAFRELLRNDPKFELHIAGEFQDLRHVEFYNHLRREDPVFSRNVVFHNWVEDPAAWLSQMGFVVCTSMVESQCKSVMEGMAMGVKPLVYNFVALVTLIQKG